MTKEEFYQEYCAQCGSQRCSGPNGGMARGCPHYILEFERKAENTEENKVTEKCLPFKFAIDGQEFEAFVKEEHFEKLKQVLDNNKKTGYEREHKTSEYYYVSSYGLVETHFFDKHDLFDESLYGIANYYSDMSVASDNARADTLMRLLRRFAVEHRENALDWKDFSVGKYCIRYNHRSQKLFIDSWVNIADFCMIYFDSEKAAELAIKTFHDELVWYFTEYKDSL